MTEKFYSEAYKTAYNNIQLTESQKNTLIIGAMNSEKSPINIKVQKNNRIFYFSWARAVACVLVVALVFGCAFAYNYSGSKNTFSLTASAAELPESEQSDAVIGAFSDSGCSEFAMCDFDYTDENNPLYNHHLLNEQGKIDYFNFFMLTELNVVGKNIESVTFKANKKFTYFSIEPLNHDEKELEEILAMFSDYESIDNSQYSRDEGDGFFAETGRCDSFTYNNPDISDEEQKINLGDYISLVVESDRTDPEIDAAVDKIEECYSAYETVLDTEKREAKLVKVSERSDDELNNQLAENLGIMDKKTLDGATIDVTVKFTDGSTQTKVLDVDFHLNVEDGVYDSPQIILSYAE